MRLRARPGRRAGPERACGACACRNVLRRHQVWVARDGHASDRGGLASCPPMSGGVRLWETRGVHTLDRSVVDVQAAPAGSEEKDQLRLNAKKRIPGGGEPGAHSQARASAPDECMGQFLRSISPERLTGERIPSVANACRGVRGASVPGRRGGRGSFGQVVMRGFRWVKDRTPRASVAVRRIPLSSGVDTPRFFGDCYGSRRLPVAITTTAIVRSFPPRNTTQPPRN